MSLSLASELVFSAREKGGGTFNANGDEVNPSSGYAVGGKAPTLIMGVKGRTISMVEELGRWLDKNPSRYFGSWADNGVAYFDAVDIVDNRDLAIDFAINRGEKAIWDFANSREIRADEGWL